MLCRAGHPDMADANKKHMMLKITALFVLIPFLFAACDDYYDEK